MEARKYAALGERIHFCFHRKQSVMVLFKSNENQKILATDIKKKRNQKKTTGQVHTYMLIPHYGKNSETG